MRKFEALVDGDTSFEAKRFDRVRAFRPVAKTLLCVSHASDLVLEYSISPYGSTTASR